MHDTIGSRTQIRRSLGDIRENKEKALPILIHSKRFMSGIPVLKKSLGK
jgi:hypothetical protein